MSGQRRTGILGGTFDPIHLGHLGAAEVARVGLALDEILVVPSHLPPHRASRPCASSYHRFAMVALAVGERVGYSASDLELLTSGPSYTSVTLERLHAIGVRPAELFFITGADAFADIATWRDYPALLDAAHFVVVSRPGHPAGALRERLQALAARMIDVAPAYQTPAVDPTTAWTVAGAAAPAELRASSPAIFLIDARTPIVSSTDIRSRVARGEPIAGLVTSEVERHIRRHRLYADLEPRAAGRLDDHRTTPHE